MNKPRLAAVIPPGREHVKEPRQPFVHSSLPTADALILDPSDPLPSARAFVARSHVVNDVLALRHQGGIFYAYTRDVSAYGDRDEAAVRASLYTFLEAAHRWTEPQGDHPPTLSPFKPTRHKLENVLDALRAVCNLPGSCAAPCWLGADPGIDPFEILPLHNGLLHVPTRALRPSTPAFFTLNGLHFDYNPHAHQPTHWLRFLDDLWPDDQESRDTLQEAIG